MTVALRLAFLTALVAGCSGAAFDGAGAGIGGKKSTPSASTDRGGEGAPSDGERDADRDDGEETADTPVWINAAYLTCAWAGVAKDDQVGARCGFTGADPAYPVAWAVEDGKGERLAHREARGILFLPGGAYPKAILVATVTRPGGGVAGTVRAAFEGLLEGLAPGEALRACLEGDAPAASCFEETGTALGAPAAEPAADACLTSQTDPAGPKATLEELGFEELATQLAACGSVSGARVDGRCYMTLDGTGLDPAAVRAKLADGTILTFDDKFRAGAALDAGRHVAVLEIGAVSCRLVLTVK